MANGSRLTDQEIAEALRVCEKATGDVWETQEIATGNPHRVYRVEIVAPQYIFGRRTHSRDICQIVDYCDWNDHPHNAKLICLARTLLPRALDELQEARKDSERLDFVIGHLRLVDPTYDRAAIDQARDNAGCPTWEPKEA